MKFNDEYFGKKIKLRIFWESDAMAIFSHLQDFEIHKNLRQLPYPYKIEDAKAFIEKSEVGRNEGLMYNFAIIDLQRGELAGCIGITNIDEVSAEIGYWLGSFFRGKGFVIEAIGILAEKCFENLPVEKIIAKVFESNTASIKVLERIGFVLNENFHGSSCNSYKDEKVLQFELKRKKF